MRYNPRRETAGIAQLVERNLAKVEVASSRLVSRSRIIGREVRAASLFFVRQGGMAEWSCSGLQSRVRRFDSDPRLHKINNLEIISRILAKVLSPKILSAR